MVFLLVLHCITACKLILHQKRARAKICVKLQIDLIAGRAALLSDEEKRIIEQALPVLDRLFSRPEDPDQ
jgi:hypothetical protein